VTAGTAARADRCRSLNEPRADLEAKVCAGQSTHGTYVHDVHRIWVGERSVLVDADLGLVTAIKNLDFVGVCHIPSESDAPGTENATFLIELDLRTEIECLTASRFFAERIAAVVPGISHVVILKPAFTGLVANRTIDGMMKKQELQ